MKIRDLIQVVEQNGWRLVRTRGSHRQFKHPTRPGLVTIAGHPADEVHPKTLRSVMIQAGIERQP
jgi:predicted RNA binding protein YcfA (HicA-like mRNA interferase family)